MATNISRAFFLSATSSSLAPFLYQTRTLAPISHSLRGALPAHFHHHYTCQHNGSNDTEATESDHSHESDHSSQGHSSEEGRSSSRLNDSPPSSPRRSYLQHRAASLSPLKTENKSPPLSRRINKVTGQERKAFGELLGQLGISHEISSADSKAAKSHGSSDEGDPNDISELVAIFGSILEDAQSKKTSKQPKFASHQRPGAWDSSADIPEEFDEEDDSPGQVTIRISDLGYTEPASATSIEREISIQEAIDIVVQKESEKIEFALFQAIEEGKGDIGLWEVCKERIFSVLKHLDQSASITMSGEEFSISQSGGNKADTATPSPGPLRVPPTVPIGPVVATLYPKTLLVAFRLLNTHFPSSQLIGQFRTTIKEQGKTSAFLGSSRALYDEMIYFYWRGCNDLPGVVSLLREMEVTGLTPSYKTRKLLQSIATRRQRDLDPRRQSKLGKESFWDFAPNKEAFEELSGPGGWLDKLQIRSRESRGQQKLPSARR
ncbi:hypothetical protein N7462_007940 [Penicillium macrosclerotiorum]|uniref:uncharacterized protein n=1 Tax=Penicillium macrosclerotiorum TaxID=303699 RepID=UPI002548DF41|nr:uncharacterized protein N7462_007940 [Penicillium macrosclerotiorum]KAJ5679696.1 hypothetical protein N7462_007940 [Penicillium macrosclerotiorum]